MEKYGYNVRYYSWLNSILERRILKTKKKNIIYKTKIW